MTTGVKNNSRKATANTLSSSRTVSSTEPASLEPQNERESTEWPPASSDFVSQLQARAAEDPRRIAYRILDDDGVERSRLTYGDLDRRGRAIAAGLDGASGSRALLLYGNGFDFAMGFLGCLYAGVVAVPVHPPRRSRIQPNLRAIARDARPRWLLTTGDLRKRIEAWAAELAIGPAPRTLATDELDDPGHWRHRPPDPNELAFLQYTSGSTSAPKGVMVTQRALVRNQEAIARAFGTSRESVIVSWLPPFHDMGLIGGLLQPLYAGATCVLMSPVAFLQKPRRWLEAIETYGGTISGGPNFAYDLCVERIPPEEREGLDLAKWEVAFNGAEPVRASTLERFSRAFGPCGFQRRAFFPCYGLAEATLFVAGGHPEEEPVLLSLDRSELRANRAVESGEGGDSQLLVGSGRAALDTSIEVVDPDACQPMEPGCVGEIWIASPSVAAGYWNDTEATERSFHARLPDAPHRGPFLRTGDLGFLHRGELFVTGRLKDLIILRGRNHYPQDLELSAEAAHPDLRAGCSAAFSVEVAGREAAVVVCEVRRRAQAPVEEVVEAVWRAAADEHGVSLHEVVLLRTGSLPKTTSGKVRRRECRRLYLEGGLRVVGRREPPEPAEDEAGRLVADDLAGLDPAERTAALVAEVRRRTGRIAGVDPAGLDPQKPLVTLGLESLGAMRLVQGLERDFGAHVSLEALLAGGTLRDLVEEVVTAPSSERAAGLGEEEAAAGRGRLSAGQEALWLLHGLDPARAVYNLAGAARVRGPLDFEALRWAWQAVVRRHDALRTAFVVQDGRPVRRVLPDTGLEVARVDAAAWTLDALDADLRDLAREPLDIEAGEMLRVRLYRLGETEHVLSVTVHHLAADFWSLALLFRELESLYREATGALPALLGPTAEGLDRFLAREERSLSGPAGERARERWRERLTGVPPVLDLPTDRPRPPVQTYRGASVPAAFAPGLTRELRRLARSRRTTPFSLLLALFQILLHRYSGQDRFIVASPAARRATAASRGVVGYLVSPLPLPVDFGSDPELGTLLPIVQATVREAIADAVVPFPLVAADLQTRRDPSRQPLTQVFFSLLGAGGPAPPGFASLALGEAGEEVPFANLTLEPWPLGEQPAQFDLALTLAETPGGALRASLRYNVDLYDATTTLRMLRHMLVLATGAVARPDTPVSALPLLAAPERAQVVAQWSGDRTARPPSADLVAWLAAWGERSPDSTAVVSEGEHLSCGELWVRARSLGARLRALGAGPESRVGVLVDRGPCLVVALLGVLEAGAAYVPLDPAHPEERLSYVAADAGVRLLVSRSHVAKRTAGVGRVVLLGRDGRLQESVGAPSRAAAPPATPPGPVTPEQLAYVIYTSGSTGRPKGVQISRGALATFLASMAEDLGLGPDDRLLAGTTVSFDIAALELFLPLVTGGCVVVAAEGTVADPERLAADLKRHAVTCMQSTPATWRLLVETGWTPPARLAVLTGGEALAESLAARLAGGSALWNLYGPTETTIWSSRTRMTGRAARVTLGRALPGTRLHVLDRHLRPVPAGIPGELAIGGVGLARGYYGRPALTAERFVPDAFSPRPSARLYRTGDLVRHLPTGEPVFLGRLDHQVKVRGHRIELGEIEAVASRHPGVSEVVVSVSGSGDADAALVAYVVPREAVPGEGELRDHLRRVLPDYMVPGRFLFLDRFPRTPNGKIDRASLPAPGRHAPTAAGRPPSGPVEEVLAGLFSDVLGRSAVGVDESFFELGGHSLLAVRLAARVRDALGVELSLSSLFERPTVAGIAHAVAAGTDGAPVAPVPPAERPDPLPLSRAQRRLWLLDLASGGAPVYTMAGALHLQGDLDLAVLERSLREIVARHEALRTRVRTIDGEPVQDVVPSPHFAAARIDLTRLAPERAGRVASQVGRDVARRPFDLERRLPIRIAVVVLAPRRHLAVLALHHMAADGWSLGLLFDELATLYDAFRRGERPRLPRPSLQYADYTCWERRRLSEEATFGPSMAYWRARLAGLSGPPELPADRPPPARPGFRGRNVQRRLPPGLGDAVRDLVRRRGGTPFLGLLAAFLVVLRRHAGRDDLTVGTPVANRDRPDLQGLVGCLVNTLVLRVEAAGAVGFGELLARARSAAVEAFRHGELPYDLVVEELAGGVPRSRDPFYQVLFTHDSAPPAPRLEGLETAWVDLELGTARHDLSLVATDSSGELVLAAELAADRFDGATILRLLAHVETVLGAAVAEPDRAVSELPVLTPAELQQTLIEWQHGAGSGPRGETVHLRVLEQASRHPDAVAVVAGDRVVSYGQLLRRSTSLALRLAAAGAGPGRVVGILADRSPEMVAGELAALHVGAAFLQLDPSYPGERLAYTLEDSGAAVVAGETRELAALPAGIAVPRIPLDAPEDGEGPGGRRAGERDLAYLVYTSGSTGRPKGVAVEHGSLADLVDWHLATYGLGAGDRTGLLAAPGFDASVWEVWPTICAGATLVVPDRTTRRLPEELVGWLVRERITVAFLPTPLAEAALAEPWPPGAVMRRLLTGGDRLRSRPRPGLPFALVNHYGPAEATVVTTAGTVEPGSAGPPSIGQPLPHARSYVVSPDGMPAPIGAPGELCVAGSALARGYPGRPALTAERFVPNPLGWAPGARRYRTGDLARQRKDGRLDFLGRIDRQIQVRGIRVEPGEIEAAVTEHPGVRDAVVVARESPGGARLVAYAVPAPGVDLDTAALRDHLHRRLPPAMVPWAVVALDALPLTGHGKVDVAALPEPAAERRALRGEAPRSPTEQLLAEAFAEVLAIGGVGRDEDFFDLGGHSLAAVQVAARIRAAGFAGLTARDVFENPTAAGLAARALASGQLPAPQSVSGSIRRREDAGPAPASSAQRRLWFLETTRATLAAYHVAVAVDLEGPLRPAALEAALAEVVRRHEALRTSFHESDGEPVLQVAPATCLSLPRADLAGLDGARREAEEARLAAVLARLPFDLARGPLLRVALLHRTPRRHTLVMVVHHLVADGWSVELMLAELTALYGRPAAGAPANLPDLAVQFSDFAAWERRRILEGALDADLERWRRRLAGIDPVLELPADRPRPSVRGFRGRVCRRSLPADLAAGVEGLRRSRRVTRFMVLLAALQSLLLRLTGREDLLVGVPSARRDRPELEHLIGLFVNLLPLRQDLGGEPSFAALLERVRASALDAYASDEVPFELLVERLRPERAAGHPTLVQVVFALEEVPRVAESAGVAFRARGVATDTSKFDFTLFARAEGDRLVLEAEHSAELYDATTVDRWLAGFERLLWAAVTEPHRRLSELPLLGPGERQQVQVEWGEPPRSPGEEETVDGLFAAWARAAPDAVALVAEGVAVTYGELRRRSRTVAARLRALGVRPGSMVAVSADRSPAMVSGLLGILEAGAAYVPLDTGSPQERLAMILEDSGAEVVLADPAVVAELPAADLPVLSLAPSQEPEAAPEQGRTGASHPGAAAYVLYTSGSTGRPKGVVVPHRAVVRLVRGRFARFGPDRVWLHLAPVSFDASTLELWGSLLHGSRLVLMPPVALSLPALGRTLARERVTSLWLTAALFHQAVEEVPEALAGLDELLAGGDVLSVPHVQRVLETPGGPVLVNGYGPTENTTFTSCHRMTPGEAVRGPVSIGRPIERTRVLVADRSLRGVGIGVAGELVTGGDGLAWGYRGRPGLTAAAFVPDAFGGGAGARLYRTGDRACLRRDGNLHFLGRLDRQLKIRGFRIEPEEVESLLVAHPAVREAVAEARRDASGDRRLVAYVVPSGDAPVPANELRAHLAERLPRYMVPSAVVSMASLPLTASGKVDRRRLPDPDPMAGDVAAPAGESDPPTPHEELVAGIWGEVLGLPEVRVDEDFFDLGGHSLAAVRVVSRLRAVLGSEVSVGDLFEAPTVQSLTSRLLARSGGSETATPALERRAPEDPAPASFAQERLWFLDQLQPESPVYNVPFVVAVEGRLRPAPLARSLARLVLRQDALRTRLVLRDGIPVQIVDEAVVRLPVVDLSRLPSARGGGEALRLERALGRRPFDLSGSALMRTHLIRLADQQRLSVTVHHAVFDGWSASIFLRELGALYGEEVTGEPADLPALPVRYGDWAAWQRAWLRGAVLEDLLREWRERLAGADAALDLPTDRPRPAVRGQSGGRVRLVLSSDLATGIWRLGRRLAATPFMVLLAALDLLLGRLSGQAEVAVGSPVAGRHPAEVEGLVGMFVNSLVLRTSLAGDPTFEELLARVREVALWAFERQELPFEALVEELAPARSLAHTPLFQVLFTLQQRLAAPPVLPEARARIETPDVGTVKFDLTVGWLVNTEGLAAEIEYDEALFDRTTAVRLASRYRAVLEAVVAEPERRASTLSLLSLPERHQLLSEWSTGVPPEVPAAPRDATLVDGFLALAAETPEAVALVSKQLHLSYRELRRRSGRIATRLVGLGLGSEDRVGVLLPRDPRLVAAILGVLEAGAAYVPLDPEYPEERLDFMLRDSGVRAVLADRAVTPWLVDREIPIVPVEGAPVGAATAPPAAPRALAGSLAYVIYTSGSTGRPKGVAIEHRSAVGLIAWARRSFPERERRGVLATTSVCFDLSVFELFLPLSTGGTVHLATDALALAGLPGAHRITLVNTVPSALDELLRLDGLPGSVRVVALAGEPLPRALVRRIEEATAAERVLNLYGPSEDTTYSTWARVDGDGAEAPSIGRAVAGTRAYLLDRRLQAVPLGVPGELFLAGEGLARAYLRRPAITAERFLPDPLSGRPGGRLYRTGDLARHRSGGDLVFLGRLDHQVKLRGFRIELGEIESALLERPEVVEAVVIVAPGAVGDPRLVAYVGGEAGREPGPDPVDLRAELSRRLPRHMVPAHVVVLPALPRTPNGKVDRRALPPVTAAEEAPGTGDAVPRTPVEEALCEIWRDLLGRRFVGVHDDFFGLGGHSLLAGRMVSRVREVLGLELPLRSVFDRPTVAGLAAVLAGGETRTALPPVEPSGTGSGARVPLSFAQERLWFLQRLDPDSTTLHMPSSVRLRGSLAPSALRRGLCDVVRRHAALRTRFVERDGSPEAWVEPVPAVELPVADLAGLPEAAATGALDSLLAALARRRFDLERGPLLRAALVRLARADHVLQLNLHHIVADGWSVGVLVRDLAELYRARTEDRPAELPPLAVDYGDYARWQRRWFDGPALEPQLAYWTDRLADRPPVLELPTDRSRPARQRFRGDEVACDLPVRLSERLRDLARSEGVTLFMLLLAAFKALVCRHSGEEDVVVGSPVAGRGRREIDDLVGVFLNTVALRTDLSGNPSFRALLRRVRTTAVGAFTHQDLPFERLLEALHPERDLGRTPLFQVFFNMLSFPWREIELEGLTIEHVPVADVGSKFDLTVYAEDRGERLRLRWVYDADLFDRVRIVDLVDQYRTLLEGVSEDPALRIGRISLLTSRSRALLPDAGARLDASWRGAVHERFLAAAERWPDRVAVSDAAGTWSYAGLARETGQLARALRAGGVGVGDLVAVHAHRSAGLVVALFGVLRAGAAFVILDPSEPAPRRAAKAALAEPVGSVALAAAGPVADAVLRALEPSCLCRLEVAADGRLVAGPPTDAAVEADGVGPEHLAYVAFTSGSTGQPKGILGRHGPLAHFLPWQRERFELGDGDRFSMLSGLPHDPLHRDVFIPLQLGAPLAIPGPDELTNPDALRAWMAAHRITVAHLTPSLARLLVPADPGGGEPRLPDLRRAFFVGEVLTRGDVARLHRLAHRAVCVNYYGTTETQQALAFHEVEPSAPGREELPVGNGAADVQLLLAACTHGWSRSRTDGMSIGELGEILIRSPHLASGYLKDPASTALRFLPDRWGRAGGRAYRTGDLGRRRPDGAVELAGRLDRQVKVRGFRVEPAEVESALLGDPRVREAAVIVRTDRGPEPVLVGYWVPAGRGSASAAALRVALAERVPRYMVPALLVEMDGLPRTATGKLDRRALPAPPAASDREEGPAPQTPTEEVLAGIWSEVLRRDRIGKDEGFFDAGGHSLLAARVLSRIHQALGVDLPLRAIFEAPTLSDLAARVDAAAAGRPERRPEPIPRADRGGELPLSYAQRRQWFLSQLEPESPAFNVAKPVRLVGRVLPVLMARCLRQLVRRHEPLRTLFPDRHGKPYQVILERISVGPPVVDLTRLAEPRRDLEARRLTEADSVRPFDLARGPLFRFCLVQLAGDEYLGLLCVHHIVADGWSVALLARELAALHAAALTGAGAPLPELAVQYADFALWEQRHERSGGLVGPIEYWRQRLAGAQAALDLPTDLPRGRRRSYRGGLVPVSLSAELSESVRGLSRRERATPFIALLAAFFVMLHRRSGQSDLVVGAPIAGRDRSELEHLVGYFINALALRVDLSGDPSLAEVVRRVRDTVLEAHRHKDAPFDRLVEELRPRRVGDRPPVFQVVFNFYNGPEAVLELPGLRLEALDVRQETSKYELTLYLREEAGRFTGALAYDADLFRPETAVAMVEELSLVLAELVARPESHLRDLNTPTRDIGRDRIMTSSSPRSSLDRLKKVRRKAVGLEAEAFVDLRTLDGGPLPLVIEPRVEDLGLQEWVRSNLPLIEEKLLAHGGVLFRGFRVPTVEAFHEVAETLCPELVNYFEGSSPRIGVQDKVYTSTEYPPELFVSLHNELSYAHKWPRKIMFFCVTPPAEGGETPIADSRKVLELIDSEVRRRFDAKGLRYLRNLHGGSGAGLSWQTVFESDDRRAVEEYCSEGEIEFEWLGDGGIRTSQVRPAVVRHPVSGEALWFNQVHQFHPSNLGEKAAADLLAATPEDRLPINAQYADGSYLEREALENVRAAFDAAMVKFPWRQGDLLLLDNMLTAHGRMPFRGPRKIVVAMGETVRLADLEEGQAG